MSKDFLSREGGRSKEIALSRRVKKSYYAALLKSGVLRMTARERPRKDLAGEFPSNADADSPTSIAIAQHIFDRIESKVGPGDRLAGQISDGDFGQITLSFVEKASSGLAALRAGKWDLNPERRAVFSFERYYNLSRFAERHAEISALLSKDYVIAPDVLVMREPGPDEAISANQILVDETGGLRSPIRERDNNLPILHASISCKWTLRSDRAQNARSEALNLIRNRKGRVPHIAVVTGEPLPSHLASLALGTGDIDCVYHFALPELIGTVEDLQIEDSIHLVRIMVEGKRLKDITDLPLDLAA